MRPKKSLGQNFLIHKAICERMVIASHISSTDTVIEVGPGRGILTRELLKNAKQVIAIETDPELVAELQYTFYKEIESKALTLVHADVRDLFTSSQTSIKLPKNYHVVANIPYYITGEILRGFLSYDKKPRSLTLLVQKEVAERIARSKKESLLSLSVKFYGIPTYCFTVSRGAFYPAPSIDSAVLRIELSSKAPVKALEKKFFETIHAGFAQKRKRLAKNLEKIAPKNSIEDAFAKLRLDTNTRSEELSLSEWLTLSRALT